MAGLQLRHDVLTTEALPAQEIFGRYENAPVMTGATACTAGQAIELAKRGQAREYCAEDHASSSIRCASGGSSRVEQARIALSEAESVFPAESIATLEGEMHQLEESISLLSLLLPNRDLPTGTPEQVREVWSARLSEWLAQYPDDPRVRVQAAYHAMELEQFERAEEHARAAIENGARFASVFPNGIDVEGEMTLERNEDAHPLLRAICEGAHGPEIRDFAARYCQE